MLFSAQCLWDVPRVQSSFILIWSMTEGWISTKAAIALLGAYCGSKRNNHCIELTFVKATELRETVLLCLERISNKKCFSGGKLGLWRHRQMNPNAARIITTTTCNSPPPKKKVLPGARLQFTVICSVRSFPLAGFDMMHQSNTCKLCVIVTEAFVKQTFG